MPDPKKPSTDTKEKPGFFDKLLSSFTGEGSMLNIAMLAAGGVGGYFLTGGKKLWAAIAGIGAFITTTALTKTGIFAPDPKPTIKPTQTPAPTPAPQETPDKKDEERIAAAAAGSKEFRIHADRNGGMAVVDSLDSGADYITLNIDYNGYNRFAALSGPVAAKDGQYFMQVNDVYFANSYHSYKHDQLEHTLGEGDKITLPLKKNDAGEFVVDIEAHKERIYTAVETSIKQLKERGKSLHEGIPVPDAKDVKIWGSIPVARDVFPDTAMTNRHDPGAVCPTEIDISDPLQNYLQFSSQWSNQPGSSNWMYMTIPDKHGHNQQAYVALQGHSSKEKPNSQFIVETVKIAGDKGATEITLDSPVTITFSEEINIETKHLAPRVTYLEKAQQEQLANAISSAIAKKPSVLAGFTNAPLALSTQATDTSISNVTVTGMEGYTGTGNASAPLDKDPVLTVTVTENGKPVEKRITLKGTQTDGHYSVSRIAVENMDGTGAYSQDSSIELIANDNTLILNANNIAALNSGLTDALNKPARKEFFSVKELEAKDVVLKKAMQKEAVQKGASTLLKASSSIIGFGTESNIFSPSTPATPKEEANKGSGKD